MEMKRDGSAQFVPTLQVTPRHDGCRPLAQEAGDAKWAQTRTRLKMRADDFMRNCQSENKFRDRFLVLLSGFIIPVKCLTRKDVITALRDVRREKGKTVRFQQTLSIGRGSDPNALDAELRCHGIQVWGIMHAAYKPTWQVIQLSRLDLLNCAVVNHMFRDFSPPSEGFPRMLR